ncbi:MAG: RagB/SusD family nutrient uptake outer membrane protein [Cyclobacteriaceae bacterium]|nr:RagB/SusD family nutrient uptake outer membrane protein [Cyclobacteriaceae bacterium]
MKSINKYNIAIVVLTLLVMVSISACKDDFFELNSPPYVEVKTVEDLELLISFPYKNTFLSKNGNGEFVIHSMTHFVHLMMSDIIRVMNVNNGFSTGQMYNRQTDQLVPQVTNTYENAYTTIAACNYIINFLETNPFPNITDENRSNNVDRIMGEALFLRAFNYYYLSQLFCPPYDPSGTNDSKVLSLRIDFPDNITTALDNTTVTTEEIYNQIVSDFNEAKDLLPTEWKSGMSPSYKYGRATKHAAKFYLSKTLLHMGKHTEAMQELEGIINDVEKPRPLATDILSLFENNSINGIEDPEVILYGFYADPLRTSLRHQVQFHYFYNKTFSDPTLFRTPWVASLDNSAMYRCNIMDSEASDRAITQEWLSDKRSDLFYLWKGVNPSLPVKNPTNTEYITSNAFVQFIEKEDPILMGNKYFRVPQYQNIPFVRSAEVYLLMAAVKANNNDEAGAAELLNIVRKRSWDEGVGGPYVPLVTASFQDVDCEWIKELAFESDRISFLQMFRKPIGPAQRDAAPVVAPYSNFFWRIPLKETDFNKF